MVLRTILVFVTLAVSVCSLQADTLRIGLISRYRGCDSVTVQSKSAMHVADGKGNVVLDVDPGKKFILKSSDRGVELVRDGENIWADALTITTTDSETPLTLSQDKCSDNYRGSLEVRACGGRLLVVNVVDVEDYLLGVVPSEMPSEFDMEALKAQAVAARTYAWSSRHRHSKEGFDLCDSTHCQFYGGVDREEKRTTRAVRDTADLVAVYKERLISALYSSDCGGTTQSGDKPYLSSVSDRCEDSNRDFCEWSGHTWSGSWNITELEKALAGELDDIHGFTDIAVTKTDDSGRVVEVTFAAPGGKAAISGQKLRSLLGLNKVKSTIFTVKVEDDTVTIAGRGFGHGMGLCQFGANGLAKSPANCTFEQILKHYYTGIELRPLSTVNVADADCR